MAEEDIQLQELNDFKGIEGIPEEFLPSEENVPNSSALEEFIPQNYTPPGDSLPEDADTYEELVGEKNDSEIKKVRWPGWPGENVFRLVVPVHKVGGIIGRKGEYIKKICQETKARIKILDAPLGSAERTVLVSGKEEPDLLNPPAVDGLLKIHKHIIETDTDIPNARNGGNGTTCTKLLVAGLQAGSLIGKQGATVKSIQDDSHCAIKVLGEQNLPVFALPDDSIVEIHGEPADVQKALELIAAHLRKFLVDRSIIGVFEMLMQRPGAQENLNSQSWGPPPPSFPMNHGGHAIARHFENYPSEISSLDMQRRGPPNYLRDVPSGVNIPSMQPQQAMIAKVTQNMQIPLSYADVIIGMNGANISYIRRASGATIAIQETRGVPGEMTIEIDGSSSQVQAAQQLIQNSIADAVSNAQSIIPGNPATQVLNPYSSHGLAYSSSAPSNIPTSGYAPTGDFYSTNYGY